MYVCVCIHGHLHIADNLQMIGSCIQTTPVLSLYTRPSPLRVGGLCMHCYFEETKSILVTWKAWYTSVCTKWQLQ